MVMMMVVVVREREIHREVKERGREEKGRRSWRRELCPP